MLISEPSAILFSNLWDATWWIIIPIFLFPVFTGMWLFYVKKYYVANLKWVNLQVSVPVEVLKTPKAMEQVFAAAHGTYSFGIKWYDKWWNGEVENWSSFEIMADSAGPRFYVRVIAAHQKMLEAAIYAQYPDAEIMLAEDYTTKFPLVLPNAMYDLQSADFILTHDDGLPIRTYEYFEAKEADEKIDTIATLMESLSHHSGEETTWIHVIVRPVDDEWTKKAKKYRDDVLLKTPDKEVSFWDFAKAFFFNIFKAPFLKEDEELEWPEDKKGEKIKILDLTPGQKLQLEAIDMKMSKVAFETVIRWTHINRKEEMNLANTAGIKAWAKQFADQNLNILKPYLPTLTATAKWPFKKRKQYVKKRLQYENAIKRRFPKKYSIMNTEELATIYHFPSATVKTPMLGRVEAKKGTPPASLPVE
ncbi:MAG: hypothetical protein Q7R63_00175 [bacterium]|nr:hypothetical protein [bacterium]